MEKSNQLNRFGWQVDGGSGGPLFEAATRELLKGKPLQPDCDPTCYLDEPPGYEPHHFYGVTDRPPEERFMGVATEMALGFLGEAVKANDPWCCFVSLFEPHGPFVAGREAYARYDPENLPEPPNADDNLMDRPGLYRKIQQVWKQLSAAQKRQARACYYASISEIDTQFGRLYAFLEAAGQLENTLVVVTSDHGDLLGAHGLFFKDISAFEEVLNVPLILRGPGVSGGTLCRGRVGVHDLCPTLLETAGCRPFDVPDSRSFASLLRDPETVNREFERGYAQYFGNRHRLTQRVVWDGPWKFVFNGFDFDELYNLDDDPWELKNLAVDPRNRDQLERMTRLFWKFAIEVDDTPLAETHYPMLRLGAVGPLLADG